MGIAGFKRYTVLTYFALAPLAVWYLIFATTLCVAAVVVVSVDGKKRSVKEC